MAAVTKVVELPAPVQVHPALERLGLFNLTVSPFSQSASITLVAVDAAGEMVAGGETMSMGVSGAQYTAAVVPLTDGIMEALVALLVANNVVAEGTVVVDAVAP